VIGDARMEGHGRYFAPICDKASNVEESLVVISRDFSIILRYFLLISFKVNCLSVPIPI